MYILQCEFYERSQRGVPNLWMYFLCQFGPARCVDFFLRNIVFYLVFTARRYASEVYDVDIVCLSVCLSVTRR